MNTDPGNDFAGDDIGYWSELKLEIIKKYALEYSKILTKSNLTHIYIDAFAGAGVHRSKTSGEFVPGSPLNALNIEPPFREFHLIDLDGDKTLPSTMATATKSCSIRFCRHSDAKITVALSAYSIPTGFISTGR